MLQFSSMMQQSKSSPSPLVKPLYKRSGISPLEAIDEFRLQHPEFKYEKISYAGRLDPMADGVLILLIGSANKERENFLHVDKSYRVEILFGISTDSYDVLGIPQEIAPREIQKEELEKALNGFEGVIMQKFPPYSSKPVNGKPLYYWARQGKLDEIVVPEKERTIHRIELISMRKIKGVEILSDILERISKVKGDFRQDEIRKAWSNVLPQLAEKEFHIATIDVDGSSGLYMRQLAFDIGLSLHTPAHAYKITRTRAGAYSINDLDIAL